MHGQRKRDNELRIQHICRDRKSSLVIERVYTILPYNFVGSCQNEMIHASLNVKSMRWPKSFCSQSNTLVGIMIQSDGLKI